MTLADTCGCCRGTVALDDVICGICGALLAAYRVTAGAAAALAADPVHVPEVEPPRAQARDAFAPVSLSPIGEALQREREQWLHDRAPIELPLPTRRREPMRPIPAMAYATGTVPRPAHATHRLPGIGDSRIRVSGAGVVSRVLQTSADGRRRDIVVTAALVFGYSCLFLPAGPLLGIPAGIIIAIMLNAMAPVSGSPVPGTDDDGRGVSVLLRFLAFCVIMLIPITLASPISRVEQVSGIASLLAASFFAYRITRTSDDVTTAGEPFGETIQIVAFALVAYAVVGMAMLAGGLLIGDEGVAVGKSLAIAGLLAGIWCWHRRFEIRAWAAGLDEPANDDGNTYGRLVLVLLGGVTGFPLFLWLGPVAGFLGLWIPTMLFLIVTWLLARPGRASGR